MHLTTPRLTVSPLDDPDLPTFVRYRRDPDVARYQSWEPGFAPDRAAALLQGQSGWNFPPVGQWMQFGVRAAGELVGDLAVHAVAGQPDTYELGVTIAPWQQRRGYAAEAVRAALGHLMDDRGAHRVFATCDDRNEAVPVVLRRLGFRHEGTAVLADWFKDEWTSVQTWAILAHEWTARSNRREGPSAG